eukprot:332678-Rhodomonas_salina.1
MDMPEAIRRPRRAALTPLAIHEPLTERVQLKGPGSGCKPAVVPVYHGNLDLPDLSGENAEKVPLSPIADLPLSLVDGKKSGSAAGTATTLAVKAMVAGVSESIATQFQETVEDYHENLCLRVLTVQAKKRPEGLFTKLSGLRKAIEF